MNDFKIILLNAKAGEGKDTYYKEYSEKNRDKESIHRVAYADAIKDIMAEYFGWDRGNKEGVWRTRMQRIGRYFRDLDKNVWVDYIVKDIREIVYAHKVVDRWNKDLTIFITDCRFDNEVIRVKELFPNNEVIVQRLHREFESGLSDEQQNDISELGISDYLVDEEIQVKTKHTNRS